MLVRLRRYDSEEARNGYLFWFQSIVERLVARGSGSDSYTLGKRGGLNGSM
jgi:hypothetical protein